MNGRTVVGVYRKEDEANSAVVRLIEAGYSRDDISVIAKDPDRFKHLTAVTEANATSIDGVATGAVTGGALGGLGGLLLGLGALTIPGVGPIIAAGPIAGLIGGALAGGAVGGLIGALVDLGLTDEEAQAYEQNLKDGDILVVVKTDDNRYDHVNEIFSTTVDAYNAPYPRDENRIFGERVDDPEDFSRNDRPVVQEPIEPEINPMRDPDIRPLRDPDVTPLIVPDVEPLGDPEIKQLKDPDVTPLRDPEVKPYTEPHPTDPVREITEPFVDPYGEDPRNKLSP